MANKNQKQIRQSIAAAFKGGRSEIAIEIPAGGYHNNVKGAWQTRRIAVGPQKRKSISAKVGGAKGKTAAENE